VQEYTAAFTQTAPSYTAVAGSSTAATNPTSQSSRLKCTKGSCTRTQSRVKTAVEAQLVQDPESPRDIEDGLTSNELPLCLQRARPVWRSSSAPRSLIVSAAGLNISKKDLCALIAAKWPVQAMRVNQKTQSVEVALEEDENPKVYREVGLCWRNMQFAIEELREPMMSYFDIVLTELPLLRENEVRQLIEFSL